jgi:tetratricopeptide (TPR) repeat protein
MMKKLLFISLCVLLLVFSCAKELSVIPAPKSAQAKDFAEHLLKAFDESSIISTISYIDTIIEKEGNKNIKSIYYNKAQLLYKIKRFDEALEALNSTDDESYDAYKATLLIRLGRDNEATLFWDNCIERNIKAIHGSTLPLTQKDINIIQATIALYVLADKPFDSFLSELTANQIITQQEAEAFIQNNTVTKELLLHSMWAEQ